MTDLTIIVLAHAEGSYLLPAIASAEAAIAALVASGRSAEERIERLLVLDRPDLLTQHAAASASRYRVHKVSVGDPGLARNAAVLEARGRHIAFLDGDDLWSANWLAAAFAVAAEAPRAVLHAEYNLIFGAASVLFRQGDPEDPWFVPDYLRVMNPWDALTFAPRAAYLATPFVANDPKGGYAHEDFHWSAVTFAAGAEHRLVPGTIHFKRRRPGSVSVEAEERGVVVRPSRISAYDDGAYSTTHVRTAR